MAKSKIRAAIKRAIAASGKSRYAVAKAAKMDPANLYNYLDAKADLRGESIDRLASVLGLELRPKETKADRKSD